MAYTPFQWQDGEAGETPITAERLNHIETGIKDASDPHTHAISDVSGLQAALDGKQASGSYATAAALALLDARVAALEVPDA